MTKTLSDQVSINKFDNKHSILLLLAFFNTSVVLAATSDLLTFSTQPVVFDERKCTVFVDAATGSNSNNGHSRSASLKSIDAATDIVKAGDTVCVFPGNYAAFENRVNGTASARIHFVSVQRWQAKVSSGTKTPIINNGDYVDIDGFEVTGTGNVVSVGISNGDGQFASHCRIFNNYVYGIAANSEENSGGAGILSSGWRSDAHYQGTDVEIFNNVVHDIGHASTQPSLVHGIYVAHPYAKIYNNIIYNTPGAGIHGWHNANYIAVSNNLTYNTDGIIMGNGGDPCATITCTSTDYFVTNNILYNDRIGVYLYAGTNHLISNNNFYQTPSKGKNALAIDPKFVNSTLDVSGEVRLQPMSPMIDAGLMIYAPSFDFDGRARPHGSAPDIGPFEFE
jgi:parallel beta-helix repeat protein